MFFCQVIHTFSGQYRAERAIQGLWGLNDSWQGVTVATTFVGAVLGGPFGDRLGRKRALAVIGALYLVGALGSALTASWGAFVAFRLLGVGVGASSVVVPKYIMEIAPAEKRGQMVVLGIMMAYVSNFLLQGAGWRWRRCLRRRFWVWPSCCPKASAGWPFAMLRP